VSWIGLAFSFGILLTHGGCRSKPDPEEKVRAALREVAGQLSDCEDRQPGSRDTGESLRCSPEWLSPDGRLLLLDTGVVLDVSTGAEVWRAPAHEYPVLSAGWSPTSDGICLVRGISGGESDVGVLYSRVPDGEPVPLLEAIPREGRDGWVCVSFGRSSQEVVVGVGIPPFGGKQARVAYYVCQVREHERRSVLAETVRLQPNSRAYLPVQMLPVVAGERVLVVNGPLTGEGAIWLLDLPRGSVAAAVTERTPAIERQRLHRDDEMQPLACRRLVLDRPGQRCVLGLGVGGSDPGCELFSVGVGEQASVDYLGFVPRGLRPPAVLPGGVGFVLPVAVPGVTARAYAGYHKEAFSLYRFDAKLSKRQRLTHSAVRDDSPVWSEALRRIIFRRDGKEIWSVSLSGDDAMRVWPPQTEALR
jgi:hypothetical protein